MHNWWQLLHGSSRIELDPIRLSSWSNLWKLFLHAVFGSCTCPQGVMVLFFGFADSLCLFTWNISYSKNIVYRVGYSQLTMAIFLTKCEISSNVFNYKVFTCWVFVCLRKTWDIFAKYHWYKIKRLPFETSSLRMRGLSWATLNTHKHLTLTVECKLAIVWYVKRLINII